MEVESRSVEIFGTHPCRGRYLPLVFNAATSQYFAPIIDPDNLGWGRGLVYAILDTGMLLNHPLIKRNLVYSVDFTGEGPDDFNGHGTMVTLLLFSVLPEIDVLNVKILDGEGLGKEDHFVQGIEWCIANKNKYKILSINLSAGVYHKKWGILDCSGKCRLCLAAEAAVSEDIIIAAAAGNEGPNQTPCPQKVGLRKGLFPVVMASDMDTGLITDYSGKGNMIGPDGTRIKMVPVRDPS